MERKALNDIIAFIDGKIAPLGYECIEVEWIAVERALVVYIDAPQGIQMEDCAKVNAALVDETFLDEIVPGDYALEISSPGVERPLRKVEHFRKFVGHQVKVKLWEGENGKTQGTGFIREVTENGTVNLDVKGVLWGFRIGNVKKANLIFDWKSS